MRLAMPTDVFDGGNGLATRGLGLEKTIQNLKVMAFAGADAFNYGSTFFQGGTADTPMGALYLDEKLSSKVHLFSRNIFSTSQTSIKSPRPRPRKADTRTPPIKHGLENESVVIRENPWRPPTRRSPAPRRR